MFISRSKTLEAYMLLIFECLENKASVLFILVSLGPT